MVTITPDTGGAPSSTSTRVAVDPVPAPKVITVHEQPSSRAGQAGTFGTDASAAARSSSENARSTIWPVLYAS